MTALIIILPVVRGLKHTLDAVEQRDREFAAQLVAQKRAPHRTRPLLGVSNFRSAAPVDMAGGKGRAPNAAGHSVSAKGRKR